MVELKDITLICIDCRDYALAALAIKRSLKHIKSERTVFLTDKNIELPNCETIIINRIKSRREYSQFVIKELYKYFDTQYCLIIQSDGYVLDAEQWDEKYKDYDYIGASWVYDEDRSVGNGGFSLRTKKLQKILGEDNFIEVMHPEDQSICIIYKFYLEEKYGIKFAPVILADKFSFELKQPTHPTFGFHGNHHQPYKKTIVFKRDGAQGDVLALEPLLEYFHKKDYTVGLDTPIHFWQMFAAHYFPVLHKSQIHPDKAIEEINLNMAYEINPTQLHLQSYYEMCGVKDGIIRNPKLRLNIPITPQTKIFNKYVVIHIDKREQEYRNIHGINWDEITDDLKLKGFDVIQIGLNEHDKVKGAIEMNTQTTPFMMWVIAGADLFIGVDSGPSHIASAFDVPSIIFFGSVNPDVIHPVHDDKKVFIHNHNGVGVCKSPFCWGSEISTTGVKCYLNVDIPPCSVFSNTQLIDAINQLLNDNNREHNTSNRESLQVAI